MGALCSLSLTSVEGGPVIGPEEAVEDGMLDFDGKVAIVTGGGGAIGSAVVRTLARLHAKVLVVDIDGQKAAVCADAVAKQGGRAISHRADVSVEAEAAGTVAAAMAA